MSKHIHLLTLSPPSCKSIKIKNMQSCRKAITDLQNNDSNEALITSRNHELIGYETKIAECEEARDICAPVAYRHSVLEQSTIVTLEGSDWTS
ncbi:hypothetical protein AVEN_111751-1 [Araneus ventricosus]|uniref:Uncharacterized protein n=1 Tax=Araneus ventricosus TaxID=182803 RepID=A0A4Y2GNU3_ARAVE|nr:hypothetical protein AVEN_111751-1 [Araneus ventricosus]